jgi:putative transposase
MGLHHVNFHTAHNVPVFEDTAYDAMLRVVLQESLHRHRIVCLRWELLPTHIHLLIQDFPDFPLPKIVQRIKGGSAYAFFKAYPQLREDLFGGHLWAKGYYHVHIATNDQFWATLNYIKTNREHAGLPPPVAMLHSDQE